MILAVDIGNTTVALGAIERDGYDYDVLSVEKFDSDTAMSQEEATAHMREAIARIMKGSGCAGEAAGNLWEGAVFSSVVPKLSKKICVAIKELTGETAVHINQESDLGLKFSYVDRMSIGHDRLCDAAWAARYLRLPAVTADLGTCSTFNVISEDGEFLGGMITAGVGTVLHAVSDLTAQLPKYDPRDPDELIGHNTECCLQSGAVIGTAALVDGIAERVEEELGQKVSLIITGGHARLVDKYLKHEHKYDTKLLFKGMGVLYERNCVW